MHRGVRFHGCSRDKSGRCVRSCYACSALSTLRSATDLRVRETVPVFVEWGGVERTWIFVEWGIRENVDLCRMWRSILGWCEGVEGEHRVGVRARPLHARFTVVTHIAVRVTRGRFWTN
eukprot:3639090-Rhodomonas_salina.1